MRFERLKLLAFGPFTDDHLDLRGGAPGGLHVIYGPNEAGKSTSLRAVKNFLFGIPRRSVDAHLHPSPRLAIGATLREGDEIIELTRLKRNKDDLVGPDGEPVIHDPLPRLLGFLDESSFSLRFGLDQVELEKGAEALLGGSEQGLFAAGTAGSDVRRVLSDLEQDASSLFLTRGKLPLLNRQNAEYEQALLEVRRSERPVEKWMSQKAAHQTALDRLSAVQQERADVRSELRRLNRLKAVMSDLLEFQEAELRLAALAHVKELPEDAFGKRLRVSAQVTEFQAEARRISEDLKTLEDELAALPEDSPICEVDDAQLELAARIGTAIAARKDLPKRRAALLEQERQIGTLLRELGQNVEPGTELEVGRQVLVGAEVSGTVGRLVSQFSGLRSALSSTETGLRKTAKQISEVSCALGNTAFGDLRSRLEALLAQARAAQVAEVELRQEEKLLARTRVQIERLRAELDCVTPLAELARYLPRQEFFERRMSELQEQRQLYRTASKERSQLEAELKDCLDAASAGSLLPSDGALREAREGRDQLLLAARRGEDTWASLDKSVRQADDLADELLEHADQVYRARALAKRADELTFRLRQVQEQMSSAEALIEQGRAEMETLAGKLGTTAPRRAEEIASWAERLRSLVELEEDQAVRLSQLDPALERLNQTCELLRRELGATADDLDLSGLMAVLDQEIRRHLKQHERSGQMRQQLRELERAQEEALVDLEQARSKMEAWQVAWARAISQLGLASDTSIERAQEVLATLQRIERVVEIAANYESRIIGMTRDTDALERDISRYVKEFLGSQAYPEDTVDKAIRLQEAIRVARHHRDERRRIRSLIEERRGILSGVLARQKGAEEQIKAMLKMAGVLSEEELTAAEQLSNEKRKLIERTQELLERIRVSSDGAPLQELKDEAEQWGGAVRRLIVRLDELDERSSELDEELRQAEADVEGTRLGLNSYRSADVAVSRQLLSERAAAARASLRKYLVVRAAHALLDEQVARYAERFSGPIAGRAGELFSRITLGKYSRLAIGVGERSLRCVRDGHEVDVSELSRGTRAQLYFVLRLASLERYFEEHQAVPLVFDDLFVDFDDDRTTVAFELLAGLSTRVQILYFTHLARDVEKAHDAVPSTRLFTHTIGVV